MLRKMINELTTATNYKYYTKREFLQLFYKILLMICETRKVLGKKTKKKKKNKKSNKSIILFFTSPSSMQRKPNLPSVTTGFLSLPSATGNPNIIHTILIDLTIYWQVQTNDTSKRHWVLSIEEIVKKCECCFWIFNLIPTWPPHY